MFADETALVNAALANISATRVANYATTNSKEADAARDVYPNLRGTLLAAFPWGFATRRVTLAPSANVPDAQWGYRFLYPLDGLYVHAVLREGERLIQPKVPFEISWDSIAGDRTIQTSIDSGFVETTYDIPNVTKWSQSFSTLMEWQLAAKLALRLSRDRTLRKETFDIAARFLTQCQAEEAREKYIGPPGIVPAVISARQ
jgi:hypothetical protein